MNDWRTEIRGAAKRHLDSGCSALLKNAIFLCERLTEGVSNVNLEDLLLHATCLEKSGEFRSALSILEKAGKSLDFSEDARYLKSYCLYKLNQFVDAKACLLYDPAEERIRTAQDIKSEMDKTGIIKTIPKQAFGLHLLGLITSQHAGLEEEAILFLELAIQLDPYLFQAREKLAVIKGRQNSQLVVNPIQDDVLSILESVCYLLASYRCDDALKLIPYLPLEQQKSSFVYCQIGRAYFEKADYVSACSAFERMRAIDPNRYEGLEVFSTALWHLKREVDLAYLARDVSERNPRNPQTWCVVGNCFSLEKEHDLAIRFFKRALQLDENFTYAYTLAGHEYIANDDIEEATACYRHALRTDRSHYNAWWGLGTIYSRKEMNDLAEMHFRRAISIHPTSSVLCCYLGQVLCKVNRYEEALSALDRAKTLQPNNAQARFQRAKVLRHFKRWEEALDELEYVRDVVPKEASVHMLMGKVCKELNQRERAMVHYVAALDLDPKGGSDVREAIDELDDGRIQPPVQITFDV